MFLFLKVFYFSVFLLYKKDFSIGILTLFVLDDTDAELKPLSCFDVSCDGRFLVAGTEVIKDDSFLLFWDIRSTNLLGGYWDTHQGDITQVNILCIQCCVKRI